MTKSNGATKTSRIGKRPVPLPSGVSVSVSGREVEVKGPKGSLKRELHPQVKIEEEDGVLHVSSTAVGRDAPRLQGLTRALVANMVHGVSEGYELRLELHGTGYRAEMQGNKLFCTVGFSEPVEYELPGGVDVDIPKDQKGQLLVLTGSDKEVIGQTAATIRGFRPPEPYGGKGIRYKGERIREKAGKAGK